MDVTFLKEDQIWGDDALDVMKKYGTAVALTDLTVILGGYMNSADGTKTSEGEISCVSWTASSVYRCLRCVSFKGDSDLSCTRERIISVRPALPPSETSKISPSEAGTIAGIRVAEYGEYPQTVADERTSEKLERLHNSRSFRLTGKNYTFDSVDVDPNDRNSKDTPFKVTTYQEIDTPFKAISHREYEMDGKRYIRVLGRPFNNNSKLSTGERVKKGKPYWLEVQPIEWLMDRSGTMVAKKCLFAGIQFDTNGYYDGDFSKTTMKHYLDTYFAKEMEPTERVAARTVSRDYEEEPVKKKEPTAKLKEYARYLMSLCPSKTK